VVPVQAQPVPEPMRTPAPAAASGAEPTHEGLQVTEAYLELRTGPGRGYPVVFAVSRGDWVVVEMRHTDWFRLRTERGRIGWAHRRDLESTLTASGVRKTFRDMLVDDYLRRRLDAGAAWGLFKKEPMLKLWTSYRLGEPLTVEATIGQVQGTFSGTEFWHVNMLAEPWADQRLSPFFSVGMGKFKNFPNQSLVEALTTEAKLANASLGLRWYLSERFVLRTDYTIYTAFVADERSTEYRALSFGLSIFF
jgi:hypothetical protein